MFWVSVSFIVLAFLTIYKKIIFVEFLISRIFLNFFYIFVNNFVREGHM